MRTFKQFILEKKQTEGGEDWPDYKSGQGRDYISKVLPRVTAGFAGGVGQGRLTAALRWGKDVIAGKPGGSHSELAPYAAERGKPSEMGFVRKDTGTDEVGPHTGAFFSRQQATRIGNKHPELKNDPTPENDPTYPSQSYDFKPEGGKKKKEVTEMLSFKEFIKEDKYHFPSEYPWKNKEASTAMGPRGPLPMGPLPYGQMGKPISPEPNPEQGGRYLQPDDDYKDPGTEFHDLGRQPNRISSESGNKRAKKKGK